MEEIDRLRTEIRDTQVIIFAGGSAKRFGYIERPKPLLPLGETTLIDYQMDIFLRSGFRRFVFLLGHMAEMIEKHLKKMYKTRDYVISLDPDLPKVGKGKALKNAILNGAIDTGRRGLIAFPDDVFLDRSLPYRLVSHHLFAMRNHDTVITVLAVSGRNYPFGVIREIDSYGRALSFEEKPFIPLVTSTGVCVVEPEFYSVAKKNINMNDKGAVEFESIILPEFAKKRKISVMTIPPNIWFPVNDPKEYEQLLNTIKRIKSC